jgi:uncharacterized protein (DUF1330 family)
MYSHSVQNASLQSAGFYLAGSWNVLDSRRKAMAAYVIANVSITDESGYAVYREMVAPTIEAYGGRYLARGGRAEMLEGSGFVGRVIVVEFPDYERALSWYGSAEYSQAKLQRQGSSDGELILVEGV